MEGASQLHTIDGNRRIVAFWPLSSSAQSNFALARLKPAIS